MANRLITQIESQNALLGSVVANFLLNKLDRIIEHKDDNEVTVKGSNKIPLNINDKWYYLDTDTDLSTATDLDTGTVAAGTDYYVYACDNSGSLVFLISAANTFPSGYDADTSRNIGGFHTICSAVDHENSLSSWTANTSTVVGKTITAAVWDTYIYRCIAVAGDTQTHGTTEPVWGGISVGETIVDDMVTWVKEQVAIEGIATNGILPDSVWDLKHRARCGNNAGMVYSAAAGIWADIYLTSGTGISTLSVNGATISDNRNWMDMVDDYGAVGKRLLGDIEFQLIATGSNEETAISTGSDPVTTGGHSDSAGRRMVSNIGCEDCCGAMWLWLSDQSTMWDDNVTFDYYDLPGNKGDLRRQVDMNDVKLCAGGAYNDDTYNGSRARDGHVSRWAEQANFASRACSDPI
jgi:hypothetical protein